MNLVDRLDNIKKNLFDIIETNYKENWLSKNELEELSSGINKEKITIGVVGQIKSGKSTFLNALIFGKEVLSTDVNPETATLTFIQYADETKAIVEFYDLNDLEEIRKFSKQSVNFPEVNAAKKLYQAYEENKDEYDRLLGGKKTISLQNLKDYTSKNGRYVHLTKSVTLNFNSEKLRDVNIVDTPGFNDPVISRELITQSFLADSDVVIILLSALRPLDKTDKELIFDKIKAAGTGKVVIIINKYDEILDEVGTEDKVIAYVKKTFEDTLKKNNQSYQEILKDTKILMCSSIMALFSQIDENVILADEDMSFHYNRLKEMIPIFKDQNDFLEYSKIKVIEDTIANIIKEDRLSILVHKTLSALLEHIQTKQNAHKQSLYEIEMEEKNLEKGQIEIENELKELSLFEERVVEKIKERVLGMDKFISQESLTIKTKILNLRDWLLNSVDEIVPKEETLRLSSNYLVTCKIAIQNALRKFYSEIRELMRNFQNQIHDSFEIEVIQLERTIDDEFKKIQYRSSEFLELKKELIRVLKYFPYRSLNIKLELDFNTFLIWGAKRSKIVEEASDQMMLLTEDSHILAPCIDLEEYIMNEHLEKLEEKFLKILILPIKNSLESAKRNLERKHNRKEEIIEKKEKHLEYLEMIDNKQKELNKELIEISNQL